MTEDERKCAFEECQDCIIPGDNYIGIKSHGFGLGNKEYFVFCSQVCRAKFFGTDVVLAETRQLGLDELAAYIAKREQQREHEQERIRI